MFTRLSKHGPQHTVNNEINWLFILNIDMLDLPVRGRHIFLLISIQLIDRDFEELKRVFKTVFYKPDEPVKISYMSYNFRLTEILRSS